MSAQDEIEHYLPPHRRRPTLVRAERLAGLSDLFAFLKCYPGLPRPQSMTKAFDVPDGPPEERREIADHMAAKMGATPEWRNGYYRAVSRYENFLVILNFNPPIFSEPTEGQAA